MHWTTRLMVFPRNPGFGRCYLVSKRHKILSNIDRNLQSGIRVKIRFLVGTGTAKGQLNVFRTGTVYRGQAQRIKDGHRLSSTGTAYWRQAQGIEDRHSVLRTIIAYRGQAQRIVDRHSKYRARNTVLLLYSEHCPMSLHGEFMRFSGRFSGAFYPGCQRLFMPGFRFRSSSVILFRCIVIYQLHSTIQRLNSWGQAGKIQHSNYKVSLLLLCKYKENKRNNKVE